MTIEQKFLLHGEYLAAGLFEEPQRSLFYRKALGLRRFYEHLQPQAYCGKLLYPSGWLEKGMIVTDNYLHGFGYDAARLDAIDPEMTRALRADFGRYVVSIDPEHSVAGAMWTHAMPNYERILAEGLDGYEVRVREIDDDDMREGLLHLIAGIRDYVGRCVAYLESVEADGALIAALRRVPFAAAETFYEAAVCWNFILYLDSVDNLGCVSTGLLPYYRGEDALPVLENLFDNLDRCGGWSMAIPAEVNALTIPCLKAVRGRRRPMTELFVDESTPDSVWEAACEAVWSGGGQPAFYNGDILLPGLKRRFPEIREEDLARFCGGGCTESMLAGYSNVDSLAAGINLALLLDRAIQQKLPGCRTYEEFVQEFLGDVAQTCEAVKKQISDSQLSRAEFNPLPMRTLLIDDCIDRGVEYSAGGARYRWSIINFAGMINVIDSLLFIREEVFGEKRYSPAELAGLLAADDDALILQARRSKTCFGQDNPEADAEAARISSAIYAMLDDGRPALGMGYLPASIQFNTAADAGRHVGATPDGRHAGDSLCESLGTVQARDTLGPTAMLQSVTALDLGRALGTPVVNLTISTNFNPVILRGLVLGYMRLGGVQLQITCVDRETLLDACEHPENHRNLIVRVGGFSEYFCNLSDGLKRNIIARTIHEVR